MSTVPEITGDTRLTAPEHVLYQEIDGRSALLNLDSETYYGLDAVGTAMWAALERGLTIGEAAEDLAAEYDATAEVIARDMVRLARELTEAGLLAVRR